MATVLIAVLSPTGHVAPLLAVAEDLVCRGNRVTVMTGAAHTESIRETGAHPHPLPPAAEFDDIPFDATQRAARYGLDALSRAITRLFLRTLAPPGGRTPQRCPNSTMTRSSSTTASSGSCRCYSATALICRRCCTTPRPR